jgi:hypothetical protein
MSKSEKEPGALDEEIWERGYDGHEKAQLKRWARLPLTEKLKWLEETQRLIEYIRTHNQPLGKPPRKGL